MRGGGERKGRAAVKVMLKVSRVGLRGAGCRPPCKPPLALLRSQLGQLGRRRAVTVAVGKGRRHRAWKFVRKTLQFSAARFKITTPGNKS